MRLSRKSILIFALAQLLFFSLPAFAAQSITVTSPNGGETWTTGSTVTISWTSSNVSYVYLDLTNAAGGYGYGDSITNLVNVVGNPGTTSWTVPSYANAGAYKLKIGTCSTKTNRSDCSGSIADVYDYSDGTITLAAATTTTAGCSTDSNCAITGTTWAGATFCDSTGLKVSQYKVAPTCQSGTCIFTTSVQAVKEDCSTSNKICDFTTSGGGVYACIAGTTPSTCTANAQITTRCICGSNVAGGAYYTWSGYDPGYCCGSGSNAYQTSPGPCTTTTTATSQPQGVCMVRPSAGAAPAKSDPNKGTNYMKFLLPFGGNTIEDTKTKCDGFIFAQMINDLCNANRITEKILQKQVALYDNNGTAYSLSCASSGCDYFACPPAGTNITYPSATTLYLPTTMQQANITATTFQISTTTSIIPLTTATTLANVIGNLNTCYVPNGQGFYSNGLCNINFCSSGYYNCDSNSVNGCESIRPCETPATSGTPAAGKKQAQCSDSDGGISIYSHGFATDKEGKISEDVCAENNLTEFYCKDGEVSMHETTCANGCNDGACVSPLAKLIQDLIALLKSIFNLK